MELAHLMPGGEEGEGGGIGGVPGLQGSGQFEANGRVQVLQLRPQHLQPRVQPRMQRHPLLPRLPRLHCAAQLHPQPPPIQQPIIAFSQGALTPTYSLLIQTYLEFPAPPRPRGLNKPCVYRPLPGHTCSPAIPRIQAARATATISHLPGNVRSPVPVSGLEPLHKYYSRCSGGGGGQ